MRLSRLYHNIVERVSIQDASISSKVESLGIARVPFVVIGSGGDYGDVLEGMRPGTAVKLTDDDKEVKVAERVLQSPMPGIVRVYSVHDLAQDEDSDSAWAIVVEKLLPLSEREKRVVARAWADSPRMGWGIDDEVLAGWQRSAPKVAHIVASAKKLGFAPDIHSGNVMKRKGGELVLADLGPIHLE